MKNSRFVVTGAAGFIGARLCENLAQSNFSIIGVDHLPHFETRTELKALYPKEKLDREIFPNWLKENSANISGIFHLGACTDTTELNWEYLKSINLEYSKSLWNVCTQNKIPFIYASSAATYGEGNLGYDDDESQMKSLKPLNPYGQSKLDFDLWALEQERKSMTPPIWSGFKFFNVYGFGERHKDAMSSVVLKATDQIRASGKVKLFKSDRPDILDGEQRRDFIHVEDVVRVLRFAHSHPIPRGIFNLGTGQARSFLDLVKSVYAGLNIEPQIEFIEMPQNLKGRYQYFTEAKMNKLKNAGYSFAFDSLELGVKKTVERILKS